MFATVLLGLASAWWARDAFDAALPAVAVAVWPWLLAPPSIALGVLAARHQQGSDVSRLGRWVVHFPVMSVFLFALLAATGWGWMAAWTRVAGERMERTASVTAVPDAKDGCGAPVDVRTDGFYGTLCTPTPGRWRVGDSVPLEVRRSSLGVLVTRVGPPTP